MSKNNKLPNGVTLEQLRDNWKTASTYYDKAIRRAQILDATDRCRLWEVLGVKFPPYQILPDTNDVNYVKANIVAGVYTVTKNAQLIPTTAEDKETITALNILLDHVWGTQRVGYYQLRAGERAALLNLGITQVGWDSEKKQVVLKNIDPTRFMRDPFSEDLESSNYCITWDVLHKNVLLADPNYRDVVQSLPEQSPLSNIVQESIGKDRPSFAEAQSRKDYYKVIIHHVRVGNTFHAVHTIDNEHILFVREDYKPSCFPFALLYCNLPAGDLIGTSNPAKIFSNSVAYNITNSLLLTAEYKNQRPPKFVSAEAGLNLPTFVKHANDADHTFIVRGDASKAVHYQSYPTPNAIAHQVMASLQFDIQRITGVDPRYTGRDTGSIITTGGVEAMLDQVTMIDAEKVENYEAYTAHLTRLILGNMVEFEQKRSYFVKDPNTGKFLTIEVDFPQMNKKQTVYAYEISISSQMPKNRARIAQMANSLMEKQMQYQQAGMRVDLITPEEWLMLQDLPLRELMQERMGIQRNADYVQKVSEILFSFAGLVDQGVNPQEAVGMVAQQVQGQEMPGIIPGVQEEQAPLTGMQDVPIM